MQKKIYVTGMDNDASAEKITNAVKAVSGVTNVVSTPAKCQVMVDYDENTADIENSITIAIESAGAMVLA